MAAHYVITGANRGIGLGFVKSYLATGAKVTAIVRSSDSEGELKQVAAESEQLRVLAGDLSDNSAIKKLAEQIEQPIDCLINNAGAYGGKGQRLGAIDSQVWLDTFTVNTLAPYFLTEALLPKLASHARVAFVSSKMGSIADNGSGGAYIYRSAKAALNAAVKSLSIDLLERGIYTVTLHPGWVKTRMGGPNALISIEESVSGMTKVIAGLNADTTGRFVNFDGAEIPW